MSLAIVMNELRYLTSYYWDVTFADSLWIQNVSAQNGGYKNFQYFNFVKGSIKCIRI